jgi:hypothetical protein
VTSFTESNRASVVGCVRGATSLRRLCRRVLNLSLLGSIALSAARTSALHAQPPFVPSQGKLLDGAHAALLDESGPALTLLNATTSNGARVGRRGSGPGEFLAPAALLVAGDSLVGVLDPANARLQWFERRGDSVRYQRGAAVDAPAMDACVIGSLVFVAVIAPVGKERIRVYGFDGLPRYAFAVRPEPSSASERESGLQFRIACDTATRSVVLSEVLGPRFEVFDLAGRALWRGSIPSFRPLEIRVDGASATFSRPPGGAHVVTTLAPVGTGRVLVAAEIVRRPVEAPTSTRHAAAFVIDLHARRALHGGDTACRLLDVRGSSLLGLLDADEPAVFLTDAIETVPDACRESAASWRALLSSR